MTSPDDIEHVIQEDIVMHVDDPAEVRRQVTAFLAGLRADDETVVAAVFHHAREIAGARHMEFIHCSEDMERVVAILDAELEPMIRWLRHAGMTDAERKRLYQP